MTPRQGGQAEGQLTSKHRRKRAIQHPETANSGKPAGSLSYPGFYDRLVARWLNDAHVNAWKTWTGMLTSPQPYLHPAYLESWDTLQIWSLGIDWPGTFPELERAFTNFCQVLKDLADFFSSNSESHARMLRLDLSFKRQGDHTALEQGYIKYQIAAYTIELLVAELTKAGNYFIDQVRTSLDPDFRPDGKLSLVQAGDLSRPKIVRMNYTTDETPAYIGLYAVVSLAEKEWENHEKAQANANFEQRVQDIQNQFGDFIVLVEEWEPQGASFEDDRREMDRLLSTAQQLATSIQYFVDEYASDTAMPKDLRRIKEQFTDDFYHLTLQTNTIFHEAISRHRRLHS